MGYRTRSFPPPLGNNLTSCLRIYISSVDLPGVGRGGKYLSHYFVRRYNDRKEMYEVKHSSGKTFKVIAEMDANGNRQVYLDSESERRTEGGR